MTARDTVGRLREASALCPADDPVTVVLSEALRQKLGRPTLRVIGVYPDTHDHTGVVPWRPAFIIEVDE